jgi:hypothetical protein
MDKIFAPLTWQDPHEKAPLFVKGNISINVKKFAEFIKENEQYISEKGWMKIVMKESKSQTIYFELDTYKPEKREQAPQAEKSDTTKYINEDGIEVEIPF